MTQTIVPLPRIVDRGPMDLAPNQDAAEALERKPLLDSGRADGASYWVLVLGGNGSRLYRGMRDSLTPVVGSAFPMGRPGPYIAPATGEQAEGQDTVARDAIHFQFIQAVDRWLGEFLSADPWPLVLVGSSRSLASFSCLTRQRRRIIGCLLGEHGDTPPTELAWLVWPLVLSVLAGGRVRLRTGVRTPQPDRWLIVRPAQPGKTGAAASDK